MNPRRRRRRKNAVHRRRHRVAGHYSNPRRRRRRSYAMNPRRRKHWVRSHMSNPRRRRRHSYRRNPPRMQSLLTDTAYAGLGFIGTKFAVGAVLPAIGIASAPSLTSMVAKGACAYVVAWAGENFLGSQTFMPLFLGGVATVIQDFVTLYLTPSFPALAGNELAAYYRPPLMAPSRMLPAPKHIGSYYGELSAEDVLS
jgi:hypothetical protein